MSAETAALAARLDDVVRTIPGVAALYSSTPAVIASVRQLAIGAEPSTLIAVSAVEDRCEIVVNIGVESTVQAPATAAAVSAAILDAVPTGLEAAVHVRVSRILHA